MKSPRPFQRSIVCPEPLEVRECLDSSAIGLERLVVAETVVFSPVDVARGDINGDGAADLVVASNSDRKLQAFLGNAAADFQENESFAILVDEMPRRWGIQFQ